MAGRRRTGNALASSLNLASSWLLHQQEQGQARREKALEWAQKFQYELAADAQKQRNEAFYKRGLDPTTGQPLAGLTFTPSPGLEPYEETDPMTGMKYRRPTASQAITESEATRVQLGARPGQPYPALAQPELIGNRTMMTGGMPSSSGGHQMLRGLVTSGHTESPAASLLAPPARPNRLADFARTASSLMLPFGRGGGVSAPRTVRPPASRSLASPSSIPQDELADLVQGIQRGVIQTRADAEALIEQAGYDPADPAFQEILSQLP